MSNSQVPQNFLRIFTVLAFFIVHSNAFSLGINESSGTTLEEIEPTGQRLDGVGTNVSTPNPFVGNNLVLKLSDSGTEFILVDRSTNMSFGVIRKLDLPNPKLNVVDVVSTKDRRKFAVAYTDGLVQVYSLNEDFKRLSLIGAKNLSNNSADIHHYFALIISPDEQYIATRRFRNSEALFKLGSSDLTVTELQTHMFLGFSADSQYAFYRLNGRKDIVARELSTGDIKYIQFEVAKTHKGEVSGKVISGAQVPVDGRAGSVTKSEIVTSPKVSYVGFFEDDRLAILDTSKWKFLPFSVSNVSDSSGHKGTFFNSTGRFLIVNQHKGVAVWDTTTWEGVELDSLHSVTRIFDVGDLSNDRLLLTVADDRSDKTTVRVVGGSKLDLMGSAEVDFYINPSMRFNNSKLSPKKDVLYAFANKEGLGYFFSLKVGTLKSTKRIVSDNALAVYDLNLAPDGKQISLSVSSQVGPATTTRPVILNLEVEEQSVPSFSSDCGTNLKGN